MRKLKVAVLNFFFHSSKGKEALAQAAGLAKFGHFGEAASLARKVLDENPDTMKKMPEITSYERKLLRGCYIGNKERAEQLGQKIPTSQLKR